MQQMELPDYVNQQPENGRECEEDRNKTGRRLSQLLLLSFGVLCIIQATLNISLRLTLNSSKESASSKCNTTHFNNLTLVKKAQYCDERTHLYNRLQERFNALTAEKNELQDQNTQLRNMIEALKRERDNLPTTTKAQPEETNGWSLKCPANWRVINQRCYFLSAEIKTWQNSRTYCQNQFADLVVINGKWELDALYRMDGDSQLVFWIGLFHNNGTFKWVDRSVLTTPFWQSGQPDFGGPNNAEDCVEMYHAKPALNSWNDAPCGQKRRWLCEKPITLIT